MNNFILTAAWTTLLHFALVFDKDDFSVFRGSFSLNITCAKNYYPPVKCDVICEKGGNIDYCLRNGTARCVFGRCHWIFSISLFPSLSGASHRLCLLTCTGISAAADFLFQLHFVYFLQLVHLSKLYTMVYYLETDFLCERCIMIYYWCSCLRVSNLQELYQTQHI